MVTSTRPIQSIIHSLKLVDYLPVQADEHALAITYKSMFTDCNQYQFRCDMGMCIKSFERCDGVEQCPDRSDEIGCGKLLSFTGAFP